MCDAVITFFFVFQARMSLPRGVLVLLILHQGCIQVTASPPPAEAFIISSDESASSSDESMSSFDGSEYRSRETYGTTSDSTSSTDEGASSSDESTYSIDGSQYRTYRSRNTYGTTSDSTSTDEGASSSDESTFSFGEYGTYRAHKNYETSSDGSQSSPDNSEFFSGETATSTSKQPSLSVKKASFPFRTPYKRARYYDVDESTSEMGERGSPFGPPSPKIARYYDADAEDNEESVFADISQRDEIGKSYFNANTKPMSDETGLQGAGEIQTGHSLAAKEKLEAELEELDNTGSSCGC